MAQRLRWFRITLRAAQLLLTSLGLVVCIALATPMTIWYAKFLSRPWMDPKGDILIVLGGSDQGDGFMGESTYLRCMYAVLIYRAQGSFRRVVVSGSNVATPMRDYLVYYGVPTERITVDSHSGSTRESALFTREILASEPGKKVLLTSDYHVFRAARAFRRAGLDVTTSPFPDAIKRSQRIAGRMTAFVSEAEETVKIAYYGARGWI